MRIEPAAKIADAATTPAPERSAATPAIAVTVRWKMMQADTRPSRSCAWKRACQLLTNTSTATPIPTSRTTTWVSCE